MSNPLDHTEDEHVGRFDEGQELEPEKDEEVGEFDTGQRTD